MQLQAWDARGIVIAPIGYPAVRLSVQDLLECASAQFDGASGQRLGSMACADRAVRLTAMRAQDEGWCFATDTGEEIVIRPHDLLAYVAPLPTQPVRQPWRTMAPHGFDYTYYLADDACRRQCLLHVARHGWARLTGVPARPGEVEAVARSFGFLRETNYGRIFDVRSKATVNNLADTPLGLEPHTDNPYRDPVPGLQLLHCLVDSANGGETRLVDGFAIAEALRAADPEAFAVLTRTPVRFGWGDGAHSLETTKPVIELALDGSVAGIRYNNRAFRSIDAPTDGRAAWRRAMGKLEAMINAPEHGVTFKLVPGELVIMDNCRILHGRLGFADGPSGARHLQGAYSDRDGLLSTLSVLTAHEINRRMERLRNLFLSSAMALNYGENLSIRAHQLQAAELAVEHGCTAPVVAACLLHDIGWALPEDTRGHEHSGAALLGDVLGPSVADPVRLHVMAKRYLVATIPEYRACLSQASLDTLALQGGPLTDEEAEQFTKTPGFEAAVLIRKLDDAAKCIDKPTAEFSAYVPMLQRLIADNLDLYGS